MQADPNTIWAKVISFLICNCGDRTGFLPHKRFCRVYRHYGP